MKRLWLSVMTILMVSFTLSSMASATCVWDTTGPGLEPDGAVTLGGPANWWEHDVYACYYVMETGPYPQYASYFPRCDINNDGRVTLNEDVYPIYYHVGSVCRSGASWGLDRIDQRDLPLDNSYYASADGTYSTIYVVSTGINHDHVEFGDRAAHFYDYEPGNEGKDCNGLGTYIASLAAGKTYGAAPGAQVRSVRVASCTGALTEQNIKTGLEYILANGDPQRSVVVYTYAPVSPAIDVQLGLLTDAGFVVVASADMTNSDACSSVASNAIVVGSTDSQDYRQSGSDFGPCLDIFAPGVDITGAWHTSIYATNTITGTLSAAALTAGVAAVYVGDGRCGDQDSCEATLSANSTKNVVGSPGPGSPNELLYIF